MTFETPSLRTPPWPVGLAVAALACLVGSFLTAAAATAATSATSAPGDTPAPMSSEEVARSVSSALDPTANPCEDFYQYACGGWLKATTIPSDEADWGRGFSEIEIRNQKTLQEILESAVKSSATPGADPDTVKLGDYYGSCMDEAGIEKAGIEPLKPAFRMIETVKDPASLMTVAGKLERMSVPVLFELYTEGDYKDPSLAIAHLYQGGLSLPEREYYFRKDADSRKLRAAFQAHAERVLVLSGEPEKAAAKDAAAIMKFETRLAKISMPIEVLRDPKATYHKLDISGLKTLAPQLPWDNWLSATGYPNIKDINVATPDFFKGLSAIVAKTKPEVLQAYLRFHLVSGTSAILPKAFVDEAFSIESQFTGQKEVQPRWKRCVRATDRALGDLLGKAYVERSFPGDSKEIARTMIGGIENAFQSNLPNLAWMDDPTRALAIDKMKMIINKVGYPDKWRDYSTLAVTKGAYFENALAARGFEFDREAKKIGNPVDRTEFGMSAPTVNAYYNPTINEIVFPAGIMQPPFFSHAFPAAMNFGGIGMVMGHELTHGFDDSGRLFDGSGRLKEWWSPEVSKKFDERAQCVTDLYSSYEVQPGVHINGKLTLGENIADMGGVKEAFSAYQAWVQAHPESAMPGVAGLNADQLFFVGFAQSWCAMMRPEYEKLIVNTNEHSPDKYRIIVPLTNFPAFAKSFSCPSGSKMNPAKQCEVW